MYYVYILYSKSKNRFYIDHSENYLKRLNEHNRGKVRSTKPHLPWEIVHLEEFATKSEAFKRKCRLKVIGLVKLSRNYWMIKIFKAAVAYGEVPPKAGKPTVC